MNDFLIIYGFLTAASIIVCLPLSVVIMFKKTTILGQKIAIAVSVLALLMIAFLPISKILFVNFSGIEYIKLLFVNIRDNYFELSELFPIQCSLFFAPAISMFILSFYKNGGIIGGILMLLAVCWWFYEISSLHIGEIGFGAYLYALCAVLNCFTPLFNRIENRQFQLS